MSTLCYNKDTKKEMKENDIMNIKIEIIEMPDVNEVRATSILRKEQIAYEEMKKYEARQQRATDDLPRFIRYINDRIDNAKLHGQRVVNFSYNSEYWKEKDLRCDYTFKGTPNHTHAQFVTDLYNQLGFEGYVHSICCSTPTAYRDGEVYLHW